MSYEWHFEVLRDSAPELLAGLAYTLLTSISSAGSAAILGLALALMRMSGSRFLRILAAGYVDVFRATPALVQVIWIYYALPVLTGISLSPLVSGIMALSLNLSAFVAEVYRSGMQAVPGGLRDASRAIGHRPSQTMLRVIVPIALRRMIPPLGTLWISLFKNSSILSIIGVTELMYRTRVLAVETYRPMEVFTALALIYFAVTYPQAVAVEHLYKKLKPKD